MVIGTCTKCGSHDLWVEHTETKIMESLSNTVTTVFTYKNCDSCGQQYREVFGSADGITTVDNPGSPARFGT